MAARAMERGRGEAGERKGGVGVIGARGMKVAARAMERGLGEAGERRGGVGAIGARGMKVAARAMERGRGEGGERRGCVGRALQMQVAPHLIIWSRNWRAFMLSRRALWGIIDKEDDPVTEGEVALEESSF